MKRFLFYFLASFAILALVWSCKKTEQAEPRNDIQSFTNKGQNVLNKIAYFRNLMQSNLKTGGSMELDSAIWYLEATLSYYNAYPDSISRDFTLFSSFYTIAIDTGGNVRESALDSLYDVMEDSLYYYLSTIDAGYKFIAFADVQINDTSNSIAQLEMISGYGYNLVLGTYFPFEADDDWIWGTLTEQYGDPPAGKCDGTMQGVSDGSNELEYRFNNPQCAPLTTPGGYTDYETIEIIGGVVVNENNVYMTYYDPSCNINYCMENEELTFFLMEGYDLIYEHDNPNTTWTEGVRPVDKDFISINIIDDMMYYPIEAYYHHYYITFARPIVANPN